MLNATVVGQNLVYSSMLHVVPFGMPTCSAKAAKANADNGVSSAGFKTQVHPAANAAPTFLLTIALGKFQGVIIPATPIGSRMKTISFDLTGLGTVLCKKKRTIGIKK